MTSNIKKQTEKIERLLALLASGRNPKRSLSVDGAAEGLTACYLNSVALLEDARLLSANGRQPRALSLTILALEELAKVPDLDELYVDPRTRSDEIAWAEFWKRFSQHKPKQKRIASYGNVLRESSKLEDATFENQTPYTNYLSDAAFGHLDGVKQRNFYVDFVGDKFKLPSADKETSAALDFLFSFAEERVDSFGSWYVSVQRSVDFLTTRSKLFDVSEREIYELMQKLHSLNDWASSHSTSEAGADLMRLMCYHSSSLVPAYSAFIPACNDFLARKGNSERIVLAKAVVTSLKRRMEVSSLPASKNRSFLMFKLLFSYAAGHFSNLECKEIFGGSPNANTRSFFG